MEPTLDKPPVDRANLTVAERERFASYVAHDPIASHQREAEQGRIAAFPRLLAAYSALDTDLAEAQGEFEELSRALDAATARATKAESILHPGGPWTEGLEVNRQQLQQDYFAMKQRAEGLQAELAGFKQEVAEDLGFLHDSAGCISDSDLMDEIAAAADRLGLQLISPTESAPPPSSPAAAGPGELFAGAKPLTGDSYQILSELADAIGLSGAAPTTTGEGKGNG